MENTFLLETINSQKRWLKEVCSKISILLEPTGGILQFKTLRRVI